MLCRFASIFSHLTDLTYEDQRNINQSSHLVSIRLIFQSYSNIALYQFFSGGIYFKAKLNEEAKFFSFLKKQSPFVTH